MNILTPTKQKVQNISPLSSGHLVAYLFSIVLFILILLQINEKERCPRAAVANHYLRVSAIVLGRNDLILVTEGFIHSQLHLTS